MRFFFSANIENIYLCPLLLRNEIQVKKTATREKRDRGGKLRRSNFGTMR